VILTPTYGYWDQFMAALAAWAAADARWAIASLLTSFGSSTEPDFSAVAPIYARMLAIALLLLGAVVAFGLMERILGGEQGIGWAVVWRVVIAVFFAYTGLAVVQYVAGYAALIATAWSPDFTTLSNSIGASTQIGPGAALGVHHVSALGLVLTAFFLTLMALLVDLELIVRSALILTVAAFVPLVCTLAVWPRMASSAAHLGEFLVGLLLSKFVVATALYVGLHLVVPALVNGQQATSGSDWMESGVAVLLIAAFSPLVLFQALRFAHGSAATVARGFSGAVTGMVPMFIRPVTQLARRVASDPRSQEAAGRLSDSIKSRLPGRSAKEAKKP